MRKFIWLVLFLLFVQTATAQEPLGFRTYLPVILTNLECMSNGWQFIAPLATTNQVLNPSGETTGNFAAVGAATITQVSTFQKYGLQSYRVQTSLNGQGLQLSLGSTLTNQNYFAQARVRGKLPNKWGFILKASPYVEPFLLEDYGDGWKLYGLSFDGSRANGSTFLRIGQIGPGSGDFYVDGIQVEAQSAYTTYCDGTQPGCAWDGAANASTSTRSGQSRAGGKPQDLFDDYGFFVERVVGAGSVTPTIGLDPYALLPGAELNSIKLEPRHFTLVGKFIADTEQELHDNRQALIIALSADSYPDNQPVKLRFYNARVPKEISVYYQGGLEGDLAAFYNKTFAPVDESQWQDTNKFVEMATIQFVAPDPMWYEIGESAAALDTNDTATFRLVAGRLQSTGQWSPLGPPAAPGTAVYTNVRALAEDATYIYMGGQFSNFDNNAAADGIVRYNKLTGLYSAMGTGTNGNVFAIAIAPNGDVYVGGDFTLAGGVANTASIARWDGTNWNALTTGTNQFVYALAFGLDGSLYVGGTFTLAGGVANTTQIAKWSGTAWSALGTGGNNPVRSLVIGLDGSVYAGGDFTLMGGVANTLSIAKWDGTVWTPLATGLSASVYSLAVSPAGAIYASGNFTLAGTTSVNRIAYWNGTAWFPLGSGMDSIAWSMSFGSDGNLYVGGVFTTAGGITIADRVAQWNGYAWAQLDIDLPGSPTVYAVLASKFTVAGQYSIWLGFDTTGTGSYAGKLSSVSNDGSSPAFPQIVFNRSGGTTAIIALIINERDGKRIFFNYSLLNGETLTLNLNPTNKTVISNFFGSRLDAILPNSDFGSWQLYPSTNNITSFVAVTGAPTVTAYLLWQKTYKSWD